MNISDFIKAGGCKSSSSSSSKPKKHKQKTHQLIIEADDFPEPDPYIEARRPYVTSEYIPTNCISIFMKHYFPRSELIVPYNETHGVYKILINELLVDAVVNWKYNRPPDMARCPDIARYIYNSRKPVDTMVHLSFNNVNEQFEVLDGIHRITALKLIKEENSKPLNLIDIPEFGSGNDAHWLYNQYIIVNIRFNASLGDLIETFKNLNKSQAVPDLYIYDHVKEKREIIENIANEWYVKYKKHFSSASNPITGNTNRNKFIELLDKLYEKHKIRPCNSDKLRRLLNNANERLSMDMPIKVSKDACAKCSETGCYLFLYKNYKLEEYI